MKRIYSLKGRKLFNEVFKRGKRFSTKGCNLIVLKVNENDELLFKKKKKKLNSFSNIRIGISISKKYGNAVNRNRAKRRIREICRVLLPSMKCGYLIIIRPYDDLKVMDFQHIEQNIVSLFWKAGILKK